jgi:histidyl-tRNA synthetase
MQELLTREVGGSRFATADDDDDSVVPGGGSREPFLPEETATRLLDLVALRGPADELLADLRGTLGEIPLAATGITELTEIIGYLDALEVPAHCYQVDLSLARGLDYYTGPIFETEVGQLVNGRPIGSVTGGGRYDELLGMFTSRGQPATGTSLGIERLVDVLEELGGADGGAIRTITDVLVTVFDREHLKDSLAVAASLRRAGINTELPLETRRLGAQLRQANQRGIPWAVFLGPDEVAAGQATIRDMRSGDQTTLPQTEMATFLQARLTDA